MSPSRRRTSRHPIGRTTLAGLVALVTVTGLTGCGGDDEKAQPRTTATSPAAPVIQPGRPGGANTSLSGTAAVPSPKPKALQSDVAFMQDMIVHHAQAITMVDIALPGLTRTDTKAIASRIKSEQGPEIAYMKRWLEKRGAAVPPQATKPRMEADSHHSGMVGMASKADLLRLQDAKGPDKDRQFLTLMIRHHQGAMTMVTTVQKSPNDIEVERLSNDIRAVQGSQVNHMTRIKQALS